MKGGSPESLIPLTCMDKLLCCMDSLYGQLLCWLFFSSPSFPFSPSFLFSFSFFFFYWSTAIDQGTEPFLEEKEHKFSKSSQFKSATVVVVRLIHKTLKTKQNPNQMSIYESLTVHTRSTEIVTGNVWLFGTSKVFQQYYICHGCPTAIMSDNINSIQSYYCSRSPKVGLPWHSGLD